MVRLVTAWEVVGLKSWGSIWISWSKLEIVVVVVVVVKFWAEPGLVIATAGLLAG